MNSRMDWFLYGVQWFFSLVVLFAAAVVIAVDKNLEFYELIICIVCIVGVIVHLVYSTNTMIKYPNKKD